MEWPESRRRTSASPQRVRDFSIPKRKLVILRVWATFSSCLSIMSLTLKKWWQLWARAPISQRSTSSLSCTTLSVRSTSCILPTSCTETSNQQTSLLTKIVPLKFVISVSLEMFHNISKKTNPSKFLNSNTKKTWRRTLKIKSNRDGCTGLKSQNCCRTSMPNPSLRTVRDASLTEYFLDGIDLQK